MTVQNLSHLALSDNGFLFDSSSGHTFTLNSVGTFILKKLIEGFSRERIIAETIEMYETTENVLAKDLDQFFHYLSELGLIDNIPAGEGE